MRKLILYIPSNIEEDRLMELKRVLREEASILGLRYIEKMNMEENLMVYYEDDEISTFLYIDEDPKENAENVRMMVRVLALIAMMKEKPKEMEREKIYT